VFLQKDQAIGYAETRACFRSGEIRVLDASGNIERTIAFNKTDQKLAESEVNSNRSVRLGRQGRLDYVNFGTYVSPHLSRCPKFLRSLSDTCPSPEQPIWITIWLGV